MPSVTKFLKQFSEVSLPTTADGISQAACQCGMSLGYTQHQIALIERLLTTSQDNISIAGNRNCSVYTESIQTLLPDSGAHVREGATVTRCEAAHDVLLTDIDDWPIDKIINIALLQRLVPTKGVAVVAAMRNEGIGLLEWVAHYRALNVDQIYIYVNDNDDGSTPLLEAMDRLGLVRLIHNTNSGKVSPQRKAYEHSINLLLDLRDYEWVFYLDADEFYVPTGPIYEDLQQCVARNELTSTQVGAVLFNWKWFGSEDTKFRTPGLTVERFQYSKPDSHVKTLARLSTLLSMKYLHYPILNEPGIELRSDLMPRDKHELPKEKSGPVYGIGQINHYWNKSFEEFLIKKFRGRGAVAGGVEQRDYSTFFEWGNNSVRGEFDAIPSGLLTRTKAVLSDMTACASIRLALSEIEDHFDATMERMYAALDVPEIFRNRGRPG